MINCPVCDEKFGRLDHHFHRKHPEYKYTREQQAGNVSKHYYCGICGRCVRGFGDLVRHYEEYHDEELRAIKTTKLEEQGISESNLSVSDLDRLIEQVNINVGLLETERKKNRELLQKCTAYAARIVELQNKIAEDTRNRY